ncbi:MAG: efflux RND transporter periplasmic adaptor subunit [Chitinophagales bacterium]|nr:efflux RND transporter periplasmic adaptor subunit [Hyphomicrobiales bacterium]
MLRHSLAWLVVIIAMGGIAGGLTLYKRSEMNAAEAAAAAYPEPSEAVASVRARQGEWSTSTRAIGTVVAMRELEIRNEIAGAIAEIGFKSGAIVEPGQTLIQFDTRQERALLAAAQAEARLGKITLERRESLRSSPAFSAQDYDRAREELAGATARANNLEVAIDKKKIVAPFRARIGITNLQPGAYLDVGTLLAKLQGVDEQAYVDFSLPQDSAAVQPGSLVTILSSAVPNGAMSAKIVAEENSADSVDRAVRFRAVVDSAGGKLRPGSFVDVIAVTSAPRPVIMVPLSAVRRSPHGEHVFLLATEDGKLRARQRVVQTGAVQNGEIAILKGLAAGDLVASSGSFKLREGLLVNTDVPTASISATTVN